MTDKEITAKLIPIMRAVTKLAERSVDKWQHRDIPTGVWNDFGTLTDMAEAGQEYCDLLMAKKKADDEAKAKLEAAEARSEELAATANPNPAVPLAKPEDFEEGQ